MNPYPSEPIGDASRIIICYPSLNGEPEITYRSPPRGPRTALPPKECERADCYFHQHYGHGCKATIVVLDGLTCRTYRQLIGEVNDYA